MLRRPASLIVALILLGGLTACAAPRASPQSWIDKPLDNTSAPLAPLTIIAHASADGGVSSIEFTIDGQSHRLVAADGARLVWRQIEWTPPGPGTYLIGARGIGANGARGSLATSSVTISGAASPPVPLPALATATKLVTQTATTRGTVPSPTSTHVTPPASVPPSAPAAPAVVAAMDANCREGAGTSFDVYGSLLAGQTAELRGRLADNSWLLVRLTGRSSNCWIAASVVTVQGSLADVQVAVAPPPPASSQPPPPPSQEMPATQMPAPVTIQVDTSPPSFYNVDAQPNLIYAQYYAGGCGGRPSTVTVAAAIGEETGLAVVRAHWHIGNEASGQVDLSRGILSYYGVIGPVNTSGTMEIYVYAQDTLGLASQSGMMYVTVVDCPG